MEVVAKGLCNFLAVSKNVGSPLVRAWGWGLIGKLTTGIGGPLWCSTFAHLDKTFCSVFYEFYLFLGHVGLVDEVLVQVLSFGAFPRAFFHLGGCKIGTFLGFTDFDLWFWGSVCWESALVLVRPLWGNICFKMRAWTCPLHYIDPLSYID